MKKSFIIAKVKHPINLVETIERKSLYQSTSLTHTEP